MKVLFTKSSAIASKLIMRVTGEDCSHCALQVDDYIVQSDFLGVRSVTLVDFLSSHTIIHEVDLPDNPKGVLDVFLKDAGAMYDWGAFFYLGLRAALPFLPRHNLWHLSGCFLCTELVTDIIQGNTDPDITPMQLYQRLTEKKA